MHNVGKKRLTGVEDINNCVHVCVRKGMPVNFCHERYVKKCRIEKRRMTKLAQMQGVCVCRERERYLR